MDGEGALSAGGTPELPAPRLVRSAHVLSAADVAKALEAVEERLGDGDGAAATARTWAAAGRVTPAGQLLTAGAVSTGVTAWQQRRTKAGADVSGWPASVGSDQRLPATPMKRRTQDPVVATTGAAAKRQRTALCIEPGVRFDDAKLRRLTSERMDEVRAEIVGHMEEVVRRRGAKAWAEWQAAPERCDRRELYMRLVHAVQDTGAQVPESLCTELMPHQAEGLEWLASLFANGLHGILADEMGLGKTVQAIALLLHVQERSGNMGPHLVVAPKSTLSHWQQELARFAPGLCTRVLAGEPGGRRAALAALRAEAGGSRPQVLVTNFEQVHRNEWLESDEWQLVIVDEGHRLKNPETLLHRAMAKIKCRMRLLLTGTPLQNSLQELWALLHFLLPDLFTCMMDFKAWFSSPFRGIQGLNEFDVQLEPEQEQEVAAQMHALLSPFLLQRLKSELLGASLPPRVEGTVRVPLSAWQEAAYGDLERRSIRLLGSDDAVSREQVNNALMQLRKIVLHPYLFQGGYECDDDLYRTSGKLEALDRMLQKLLRFGHKVLVFSQFTSMLDILEDFLRWRSIACVRLDGQVPHEERARRIQRFNADPKLSVFLLSARAGGLGLNLQAADTVVLFDLDWNPQNDKQAVARVHRVGQTREVRVLRLLTDSAVERHMEQCCLEKLEMERKILTAGMFHRHSTADQRGQALRAVLGMRDDGAGGAREDGPNSATAAAATSSGITPPDEVNRLVARSAEELACFVRMDDEFRVPEEGACDAGQELIRSSRLMSPEEVPRGFTCQLCKED